jgi:hypothetical protein
MSDRLNAQSTGLEAKKYVLFYKYLSFDEDFGPDGEQLLMEAGKVLDSLSESESESESEFIPENLLNRLVEKFGDEYD